MLDYDGQEAVARPFGRSLREAITWMLIDAEGLMTALESADVQGAQYVGRRVDQAWRRVEHFAANWLGDDYQDTDPQRQVGGGQVPRTVTRRNRPLLTLDRDP